MKYLYKKTNYVTAMLLCLLFATIFLLGGLLAQLKGTAAGTNEARVAVMAADAAVDIPVSVGYPGASTVIPVVLTNSDGGRICEVAQRCSVTIEKMTSNLPLTVELYSDAECTDALTSEEGVYGGEEFEFPAGEKKEIPYYLKVTWQEDRKEPNLAFEIDYLSVKVSAVQID